MHFRAVANTDRLKFIQVKSLFASNKTVFQLKIYKMKKIILISALAILAIFTTNVSANALNQAPVEKEKTIKVEYTCPMHPEVVSDKPGQCPKCGMDLVKKEVQKVKVIYTCPMHKDVVSDKPGKCPKCGMKLQKKEVAAPDSTKVKKACCGNMKM
jgi:hypothetical protein